PAKLDDDITIHTRCTELKAASCRMHQKAFRGEELLAEAHLRVGFVSPNGRPIRQPEEWRAAFARFVDQTED
ncbi:MAG: acyl-CoA thioesterase, partial [Qipengyuania vulgaris]